MRAEYTAPKASACTLQRAFLQSVLAWNGTFSNGSFFNAKDNAVLSETPTLRSITYQPEEISRPYFFRSNIESPVYQLYAPSFRNASQPPPTLTAWGYVTCGPNELQIARVVHAGDQPLQIVPRASLSLSSHAQVIPNASDKTRFSTFLYPVSLSATPQLKSDWTVTRVTNDTDAPGEISWQLNPRSSKRSVISVQASTSFDGREITEGYRPIGYGDLPRTNLYTPATIRIVPADLKLPEHHKIAYLPGTGDSIPEALASLDLTPTILTVSDLVPERLKQYDTVILGVRTYNAHPDLHGRPTQALLEYARNGGNVLVQFQT